MKTKKQIGVGQMLGAILGLGAVLAAAEKAKQNKLTTKDLNKFKKQDLLLHIDELNTKAEKMRTRIAELNEQLDEQGNELQKSKRWATLRNNQVGQLINAVENMAASNNLQVGCDE